MPCPALPPAVTEVAFDGRKDHLLSPGDLAHHEFNGTLSPLSPATSGLDLSGGMLVPRRERRRWPNSDPLPPSLKLGWCLSCQKSWFSQLHPASLGFCVGHRRRAIKWLLIATECQIKSQEHPGYMLLFQKMPCNTK